MSAWEGRPDEASVAAIPQEAGLAVALGEACAVAVEGEAPSERHAGPCAIRYTDDTQFDIPALLAQCMPPLLQCIDKPWPGFGMGAPGPALHRLGLMVYWSIVHGPDADTSKFPSHLTRTIERHFWSVVPAAVG
jgi:hypothetical protein